MVTCGQRLQSGPRLEPLNVNIDKFLRLEQILYDDSNQESFMLNIVLDWAEGSQQGLAGKGTGTERCPGQEQGTEGHISDCQECQDTRTDRHNDLYAAKEFHDFSFCQWYIACGRTRRRDNQARDNSISTKHIPAHAKGFFSEYRVERTQPSHQRASQHFKSFLCQFCISHGGSFEQVRGQNGKRFLGKVEKRVKSDPRPTGAFPSVKLSSWLSSRTKENKRQHLADKFRHMSWWKLLQCQEWKWRVTFHTCEGQLGSLQCPASVGMMAREY
ncbi:hypothetical protein DV515_00010099 [Chloebia gouldiae]|uniref:Uncharacterized protein n=1 Tax=Chloebia gouldiae TaxID=44316 RepID=A0A3L8SBH5_CHLGU|nr:hypothetical protein DV515_00010099 [Chloebia gouldiae]